MLHYDLEANVQLKYFAFKNVIIGLKICFNNYQAGHTELEKA